MCLDNVRLRIEMEFPDIFQQHCASDDLPCVSHQIFQEPELTGLKIDAPSSSANTALHEIELKIGHLQQCFPFGERRPTTQCIHPRDQLGKRERFDQIIVAAPLEAGYAVIYSRHRCQKQNGCLDTGSTNGPDQRKTINSG